MMKHTFSEEIFADEYGRPRGKGIWIFGDRNKHMTVTIGSQDEPLDYRKARKLAAIEFEQRRFPIYKTIYLHP